ncbi:hypothetical protein H2O64_13770 [Kordia sp. YSTF-M3]|uniref:GLPGLI family protein n=1 Tax=Kordia aestuariivivens TaxID=2759037 RepID=A0ABR7QB14_9FLAO|nr:hypothetical protein [Kordia aestuariivivens]MBC8755739.1 hypothetical protein [Kordia aestuariivivens]
MKKYLALLFFMFCVHFCISQNIRIENETAYVDDKVYVKIEKQSKRKYIIYDVKTNEKLLKFTRESKFNQRNQNYDAFIKVYFFAIKKDLIFRDITIHDEKDIIQFLHEEYVFLTHKIVTTATILEDYKRLSARAKCDKILKNDFTQIVNDHFISVAGKDTIVLNEIKYLCVYTAFYTKKAMYDRYGKWHKSILPYPGSHRPNLVWNNIKLLDNVDKKFTVIARGYEGQRAMYASMMILDEQGKDMLHADAPYRFQLVELFGSYIKNNSSNRGFYKAYWTTFDPERWKQIQEHKRRKNTTRARSPFYQKPSQPRTTIRDN